MCVKHFVDGINQTFQRLGADFFLQLLQNFRFTTAVHSATGNLQKKKEQTDNVLRFFTLTIH